MKFLIQTVNNVIVHDFAFTLIEAIKYSQWRKLDMTYELTDEFLFDLDDSCDKKTYYKSFCPIGTVEFVVNFIKYVYGIEYVPKPINIPTCLMPLEYTKRLVSIYEHNQENEVPELYRGYNFYKDMEIVKSEVNGWYKLPMYKHTLPNGKYLVSEKIDMICEYRCFVYNNQLRGIQYYSGDFTQFLDVAFVKRCMKTYEQDAPIAYTLDVGVNDHDGTFVIEVHDFWSCGLYGFSDLSVLPYMFYRWFKKHLDSFNK